MTCLSKEQLVDYLFSQDRSVRGAIEVHIKACAGCRARIESLKQLKAAAVSAPLAPVSADFTARLMRSLPAEAPKAPEYLRAFYKSLFRPAWAFGLAAFAVASYFGLDVLREPRVPAGNTAEVLYFSDGPVTVNRGISVLSKTANANPDVYSYTDNCATARCGML